MHCTGKCVFQVASKRVTQASECKWLPLQLGLGMALEYILDIGVEAIWERVQFLAGMLRDKLSEVQGATVQDKGRLLCGIVSFTLVGAVYGTNNAQVCQSMLGTYWWVLYLVH